MTAFSFQKTLLAGTLLALCAGAQANVVTSVKPLSFIASSIAEGVTEVETIVPPGASPHDYNLKPSDVQKIKSADLLLWIGKDVDGFLEKSIHQIDHGKVIEIAEIDSVTPLLTKSAHHHHDHEDHHEHEHSHAHKHGPHDIHDDDEHEHDEDENGLSVNWHVWYSPQISRIVASEVAEKLTAQYPDKKAQIEQNLQNFDRTLQLQSEKIRTQLAAVKDRGFYVFHDAYGYFNQAYGLNQIGAFTINPLVAPGAKTLATIKAEIAEHKVSCLFAEPQFTPKVIESLSKGTEVKIGRLDPMGESVKLSKNAYTDFLQATADSYFHCLNK
ncbi:zinc ABC transporter substrate-binding protein [Actinobacillus succinogenes]|uniref:High-affinity zinc uptake system protein ZnuA n=1 Tax=Actinobacillus succinogenes (strain ATCC 55618 / DSM 22257 / CCUG 43843 / 130Z) TaxID=339671 RepID=A6VQ87_ACTSZ|nr:zinc ABC transporter substrate-binding protein ZnuA [Actinobacillus succinogenes]ABR75134.1 periplasmic solute binding protein [Actinobacillus succinogenes 130Z]PHI40469.1 zinc ABC transporter substrate-binding protein [Actinobacillus succinogenes]